MPCNACKPFSSNFSGASDRVAATVAAGDRVVVVVSFPTQSPAHARALQTHLEFVPTPTSKAQMRMTVYQAGNNQTLATVDRVEPGIRFRYLRFGSNPGYPTIFKNQRCITDQTRVLLHRIG